MAGLIPFGELEAAADLTTAELVKQPSQTRAAVDGRIQGVAAGIIAGNPTVVAAAEAAADEAVTEAVASESILMAYPEVPISRSGLSKVPVRWRHKTMSDPYGDSYVDEYVGSWVDGSAQMGDVALVGAGGTLSDKLIPSTAARVAYVNEKVAALEDSIAEVVTSPGAVGAQEKPYMFWGLVNKARRLDAPVPMVFLGSSTTAAETAYPKMLPPRLNEAMYPEGVSTFQRASSADFVEHAEAGIHSYNAGIGGSKSSDYATSETMDKIVALDPAVIVHMIGANDYTSQVNPASYRANIEAKLNYFDARLPATCTHVLVQSYARLGYSPSTYEFTLYGAQQALIAQGRRNVLFVDLTMPFKEIGIASDGDDPLQIMQEDLTHLIPEGQEILTDFLYSYFIY
ncbi:SGNH/GDSL hydrolase family protein [Microbacterium rhizophilus]|uniref:SGNH/GDSL hydrolase family protein n=1 Tax=Microbacterium rhizophilus TaxID=3138934 RepID=UPI0031E86EAC